MKGDRGATGPQGPMGKQGKQGMLYVFNDFITDNDDFFL